MADQIQVTKLNQLVLTGPQPDNIKVPKLVMYVLAVPGETPSDSTAQGHVTSRIITRS